MLNSRPKSRIYIYRKTLIICKNYFKLISAEIMSIFLLNLITTSNHARFNSNYYGYIILL